MYSKFVFTFLLLYNIPVITGQKLIGCPLSWNEYNEKCYKFVTYPLLHYDEAVKSCQGQGAALVSINDVQENEFIRQQLLQIDIQRNADWFTSGVYIEGVLQWQGDGTVASDSDQYWNTPADKQTMPIHMAYHYTGVPFSNYGWTKINGNILSKYICEIPKSEIQRIVHSQRDFTYGTNFQSPSLAPRGPSFAIQPHNVLFTARSTVSYIECVADGNPSPVYSWYKGQGNNVTQKITANNRYTLSNGRLTISRPNQTSDIGTYQCRAENMYGSVLSSFVEITWGFLEQFSNVPSGEYVVPLYQGAFLNCIPPSFKPAVTYQWRKDGNFLMSELNNYFFLSTGGNLYFSEVQQHDQGDFHCVVTLAAASGQILAIDQPPSRISPKIHLRVTGELAADYSPQIHNDFPTVFPKQPLRGQMIRMECMAYGRLPLKYSWRRVGKPIPKRAKFADLDRVMIIDNVQIDEEGTYSCHVGRIDGTFDEKSYTLEIGAAPYFVSPLANIHADINSDLTWRCEAIGKPRATYTWYKNSMPLIQVPGKLQIVSNVLTIKSLTESDAGMYQCGATNLHGTTFSNAQLRVLSFKPSFVKNPLPTKILAGAGGNLTLPCAPEAAPTADIIWLKNNQNMGLTPGTIAGNKEMLLNGYLKFNTITAGDQGFYTCSAENSNGKATSTAKVEVAAGVTLPTVPANTPVNANNTAFLRCEASYNTEVYDLVYEWRFNGHTINFDTQFGNVYQKGEREGSKGLYIHYADFHHGGEYECVAITTSQRASAKANLIVYGPPGEPAGVYCEKNTATPHSIQVTWLRAPDHGSSVQSYMIETSTYLDPEWKIHVPVVKDDQNIMHPTLTDRRTFIVHGLTPFSGYRFRISAKNTFPDPGPPSLPSDYYTLPKAPPVRAPSGVGGGQGSVGVLTITWHPLPRKDWGGEVIGYRVYWRRQGSSEDFQHKILSGDVGRHVESLGANYYYLPYEVKVGAFNEVGPGPNSTVSVVYSAEGMPTIVPTHINGYEYNSTAIIIYWDKIPNTREAVNGRIIGFEINFVDFNDENAKSGTTYVYGSELTQGMVIGLFPNSDYWFTVQVFTSAGESNPSERQRVSTYLSAPFMYPEYVNISSHGSDSVYVYWRGISTGLIEEPILGYKLRYWPMGDNINLAKDVVTEKVTSGIIYGIEKDMVYQLRVLGYSRGGDGKKSPKVYFTLGGQVTIDPATSEIIAGSRSIAPSIFYVSVAFVLHRIYVL